MKRFVLTLVCTAITTATAAGAQQVGGGTLTLKVPNNAGAVTFSHDSHVAVVGLTCRACHTKLFINQAKHVRETMATMQQGRSCGACHDGKTAFGVTDRTTCASCHAPAERR